MNINLVTVGKKLFFLVLLLILANLASTFLFSFLSVFGGNIQVIGLNQVAFDPLITMAYMMLFYFITLYFQPKHQLALFLFTLFLSFTVNFIQGSIFLVVFYFLLRKFKLV